MNLESANETTAGLHYLLFHWSTAVIECGSFWSSYLHDEGGGDYGADTKFHKCAWTERIKKKKKNLNESLRDLVFT